jgi:hypothetical protein
MTNPGTTVFRPGDVSYLRIPAMEPAVAGASYEAVFGWHLREGDDTSLKMPRGS